MKVITIKKELINKIGNWKTNKISSNYEVGSNRIELSYNNEKIMFVSDNIKDVAYIALECHAINNKQYAKLTENINLFQ